MAIQQDALLTPSLASERKGAGERWLFSPIADFFLLGGGSVVIMAIMVLMIPVETGHAPLLVFTLALTHVINHPHFAHSYQIFYRSFGKKIRGEGYGRELQIRYVLAGIVVPIAIAGAMIGTVIAGDAYALGLSMNVMMFFVGWHYVKQGYGMLMLDAALKKRFFGQAEKRLFLTNAYVTWICHWIVGNALVHERNMWGLKSYAIPMPGPLLYAAMAAAAATTLVTILVLLHRAFILRKPTAINGVIAYFVSIYIWLFAARYPIIGLITPAFHSLQYLAVVWRYRLNFEASRPDASTTPFSGRLGSILPKLGRARFLGFIALGIVIGYLGFWGVPEILDSVVPYDRAVFGSTLFIFAFWVFINVHHYFLDSVMWRRGNPDVQKHLFA